MMLCHLFDNRHSCITAQVNRKYCTISTVSSVTRQSRKKSPRFKSLEFKIKFIGHLGQQIFRIHKLTVEMVQYSRPIAVCAYPTSFASADTRGSSIRVIISRDQLDNTEGSCRPV